MRNLVGIGRRRTYNPPQRFSMRTEDHHELLFGQKLRINRSRPGWSASLILLIAAIGTSPTANGAGYRLAAETERLEEDLAKRFATRDADAGAKAQISLRVLLHHLYSRAQSIESVSTRALFADRADLLRRSLKPLDAQLGKYPQWEQQWLQSSAKQRSRLPIRSIGAKLDAVANLNRLANELANTPVNTPQRLNTLTNHLGKTIAALADIDPAQHGTWAFSPPPRAIPTGQNDMDLDALAKRVLRSRLSLSLREQMSRMIQDLAARSENGSPDSALTSLLNRSCRSLDATARLAFLSAESRAFLDREAMTAWQLFGHPAMRSVGMARLNGVVRTAEALAGLDTLRVAEPLKRAAADRIITIARKRKSPVHRAQADEALATFSRCVDVARRLTNVHEEVKLRKPYARPFAEARSRYADLVTTMIAALGQGKLPAAQGHLATLRRLDADLVLLAQVPNVSRKLRDLHPPTPGLIDRHVAQRCAVLLETEDKRKAALIYLKRLRDIGRSMHDAHRWRLDKLSAGERVRVIGEETNAVQAALDRVRRRIAEAYIKPPGASAELAKHLRDLADYLLAVHTLAKIRNPAVLRILNRDRAIELLEPYAGGLLRTQHASVRNAAHGMAADPRAQGVGGIGRIRQLQPAANMLALLSTAADKELARLPDGLPAVAGQLLARGGRNFTIDDALRKTCLLLNEAGYDLQVGLDIGEALKNARTAFRILPWTPAGSP